jgi:hypothetical protein
MRRARSSSAASLGGAADEVAADEGCTLWPVCDPEELDGDLDEDRDAKAAAPGVLAFDAGSRPGAAGAALIGSGSTARCPSQVLDGSRDSATKAGRCRGAPLASTGALGNAVTSTATGDGSDRSTLDGAGALGFAFAVTPTAAGGG